MSELSTTGLLATFFDTQKPNMARMFNYMVDGPYHFEVDRIAANEMISIYPGIKRWVQVRYAFVQESYHLMIEQGFKQFLDLGSGIPAEDLSQVFPADARVIFCDINPVAVSYGQSLFSELDNIDYIQGDVRDLDALLASDAVQRLIDPQEKIGIGLNGIPSFISKEACRQLNNQLYERVATGSKMFFTIQTQEQVNDVIMDAVETGMKATGLNLQLYTREEVAAVVGHWQLDEIQSVTEFLGLPAHVMTDIDRDGSLRASYHAAFYVKRP